jgi:hypothetical protein
MSKGLKIMSLGVINHGMSLSVLYLSFNRGADFLEMSQSETRIASGGHV